MSEQQQQQKKHEVKTIVHELPEKGLAQVIFKLPKCADKVSKQCRRPVVNEVTENLNVSLNFRGPVNGRKKLPGAALQHSNIFDFMTDCPHKKRIP